MHTLCLGMQVILERLDRLKPHVNMYLNDGCPQAKPCPHLVPGTQVILERLDRLKPRVNMCLKVASVMGQWVDLDILHKFYPIVRSKWVVAGTALLSLQKEWDNEAGQAPCTSSIPIGGPGVW